MVGQEVLFYKKNRLKRFKRLNYVENIIFCARKMVPKTLILSLQFTILNSFWLILLLKFNKL